MSVTLTPPAADASLWRVAAVYIEMPVRIAGFSKREAVHAVWPSDLTYQVKCDRAVCGSTVPPIVCSGIVGSVPTVAMSGHTGRLASTETSTP
jgi:hypothetical protein